MVKSLLTSEGGKPQLTRGKFLAAGHRVKAPSCTFPVEDNRLLRNPARKKC